MKAPVCVQSLAYSAHRPRSLARTCQMGSRSNRRDILLFLQDPIRAPQDKNTISAARRHGNEEFIRGMGACKRCSPHLTRIDMNLRVYKSLWGMDPSQTLH